MFLEMLRIVSGITSVTEHFTGLEADADGQIRVVGPESFGANEKYLAANVTSVSSSFSLPLTSVAARFLHDFTSTGDAEKLDPSYRNPNDAQKRMKRWRNHRRELDDVFKQSPILWTLGIVEFLEHTTGFGLPYEGEGLKVGSQRFTESCESLKSALPGERAWDGDASKTYADKVIALQGNAQKLAELDSELAAIIYDQADINTDVRLGLGTLKDFLFAAYIVEQLIFALTVTDNPAGYWWSIAIAGLGTVAALAAVITLCTFSFLNGKEADEKAGQYQQLDAGAPSAPVQPDLAAAPRSTVSHFHTSLTSTAHGPADHRASAVGALANSARDGAPTQTPTTPAAPMAAMPTLADPTQWTVQVTAKSGQTTRLAGYASPQAALVNQAIGQAQGGSTAQRDQQTPAEEPTDSAQTGEKTSERAPLAATAAHQHTPQPQPAQL